MTRRTTFGFGLITAQHDARDGRTDTELYADILDLCTAAESLGFDAIWLSEHHFVDDGYMPSLLTVAAAIAARTTRISIGTGVLLAPFYNPLRLAEDTATVDLLSAGRLVVGLGAGYRDEEFAGFGQPKSGLGAVLDHTIASLRQAWSAAPVRLSPDLPAVSITPKPHRAAGPPIWLGARSRPGVRRTGRLADGLIAARVSPVELGQQVQLLDTEIAACGRSAAELTVSVHCPVFAWPVAEQAWQHLEPQLYYSEWKYTDMGEAHVGRSRSANPPPLSDNARHKIRLGALVGSPSDVADGIAAYARAAGDRPFHFIARLYWPGMDADLQREAMSVYCEQVIPAVQDRLS
jgi:alkanesulfonate monooxygenase SsuD/methylene tetrahydromethanopterin reductase-like flavin-dependent oxidoreductase (luciferase family)